VVTILYRSLFSFEYRLVLGTEPSAHRHSGKGDEVGHLRHLTEDDEGKKRTDKGRNGVISTCPRRAENPLGVHVKENAQPVRHKSHAKHGKDAPKVGQPLSDAKPDDDRTESRENALIHLHIPLQGIF